MPCHNPGILRCGVVSWILSFSSIGGLFFRSITNDMCSTDQLSCEQTYWYEYLWGLCSVESSLRVLLYPDRWCSCGSTLSSDKRWFYWVLCLWHVFFCWNCLVFPFQASLPWNVQNWQHQRRALRHVPAQCSQVKCAHHLTTHPSCGSGLNLSRARAALSRENLDEFFDGVRPLREQWTLRQIFNCCACSLCFQLLHIHTLRVFARYHITRLPQRGWNCFECVVRLHVLGCCSPKGQSPLFSLHLNLGNCLTCSILMVWRVETSDKS